MSQNNESRQISQELAALREKVAQQEAELAELRATRYPKLRQTSVSTSLEKSESVVKYRQTINYLQIALFILLAIFIVMLIFDPLNSITLLAFLLSLILVLILLGFRLASGVGQRKPKSSIMEQIIDWVLQFDKNKQK